MRRHWRLLVLVGTATALVVSAAWGPGITKGILIRLATLLSVLGMGGMLGHAVLRRAIRDPAADLSFTVSMVFFAFSVAWVVLVIGTAAVNQGYDMTCVDVFALLILYPEAVWGGVLTSAVAVILSAWGMRP